MSDDEARLHLYLDDHPDDVLCRQALADLLEERGDSAGARCQRWLAERHRWPDSDLAGMGQTGWHWWASVQEVPRRQHALLPRAVQAHMPVCEWLYPTRRQAEAVLASALAALDTAGGEA
jgi:hypothetical protein